MIEKLVLPVPPSANDYWKVGKGPQGKVIIIHTDEAKLYRNSVGWLAKEAGVEMIEDLELSVSIVVYRKRKAGDLDNYFKQLFDALNGIAWKDDSQIVEIYALRQDDKDNPRVEVSVYDYRVG